MENKSGYDAYDANSIKTLSGISAIRKRSAMYIGEVLGGKGIFHLIKEIVANSCDEYLAGFCSTISIQINADGNTISILDDGRGIPVKPFSSTDPQLDGKSTLEVVLGTLHAGGKFEEGSYKVSAGLHGVGSTCVNALSDYFYVEVTRDGGIYCVEYSKGELKKSCTKIGNMKKGQKTGTLVTFKPDIEIFKDGINFDDRFIIPYLRECAFLNRGLNIKYENISTTAKEDFCYQGGIIDYVQYLTQVKSNPYPKEPIYIEGDYKGIKIQVAIQYTQDDDDCTISFANNVNTSDGGTHLSGYRTALTRIVNNFYKNVKKDKDPNLSGEDIREGMCAVLCVYMDASQQPEFVGQTKNKLGSIEAESAVSTVLTDELTKYFEKNPPIIKAIIDRALLVRKAKEAAKKQLDLIKRKSIFGDRGGMPDKLADCRTSDPKKAELYIVEGDSAQGSGVGGRDSDTQAILPLRGKIINAEKHGLTSLLKNNEVQSLIKVIGCGINDDFNLTNLRYHKVIIMTDADDDGSHIASLLMTFFFRYMKPLVTNGHLYLANPPLYKVTQGKNINFAWDETELKQFTGKSKNAAMHVVRFKGLGEMNAEELGETTMNPENRHLIKLEVNDLAVAERQVTILMGNDAEARKIHIKSSINNIIAVK